MSLAPIEPQPASTGPDPDELYAPPATDPPTVRVEETSGSLRPEAGGADKVEPERQVIDLLRRVPPLVKYTAPAVLLTLIVYRRVIDVPKRGGGVLTRLTHYGQSCKKGCSFLEKIFNPNCC